MAHQESQISGITPRYTQTGHLTGYIVEVRHDGLNEIRTISDRDEDTAIRKAEALGARWNEKWHRVELQRSSREEKHASKQQAEERTAEAQEDLQAAASILRDSVDNSGPLAWDTLEDRRKFVFSDTNTYPSLNFGQNGFPISVKEERSPREPQATDPEFAFQLNLWEKLWPAARLRKQESAVDRFGAAHRQWQTDQDAMNARRAAAERQLAAARDQFEADEFKFKAEQTAANDKLADFKQRYEAKQSAAVVEYCELALAASRYPTFVDPEYQVSYNPINSLAVVECELPDKDAIPTLIKVTYIASSGEFKEKNTTDSERDKLFDSVLYQIALRTIHELLQADSARALKAVVFNGWVNALSPASGKRVHGCILSLQASKQEFESIDLSNVDPKACFKQLKGVAASRLSGMTPVRPILQLQADDPRFIDGHEVASQLEESYNLATMAWEDFEHLVRQLFEEEFRKGDAEVHVTRASSDGGVDAVILDPDPLHGGKIVIQAKRYTNTVGLSAVRDLYGTVINEGANRGILVSTADYGPEAYEFIKGKPLTLLSGANLLHLLAAHGHRARIDLKEAKILNRAGKR